MAKSISLLGLLVSLIVSCTSIAPDNKPLYCGYELTRQEYEHLRTKAASQKSAYEADCLWHIYDQLNDSIRSTMPDSVEFEIFLSLLNNDEVGIDIYVPRNKEFFEKINKITNQKSIFIPIPNFVLSFLGLLGNVLRFLNIKTNLSSSNMTALKINNFYTNQKSIKDLQIDYYSAEKAISDAIKFFEKRK